MIDKRVVIVVIERTPMIGVLSGFFERQDFLS